MEAIKSVYSLEILYKHNFDDCNYLKFPVQRNNDYSKTPDSSVTKVLEVEKCNESTMYNNKLENLHQIDDKFYESEEFQGNDKNVNEQVLNKDMDRFSSTKSKMQIQSNENYINLTAPGSISDDTQVNKFPKNSCHAKQPSCVWNCNEPPGLTVKHPWKQKLDTYAALPYTSDSTGRLMSGCLGNYPNTSATGDASLQSTQYKIHKHDTLKKPLRLFDKQGKPLTDRIGRPLLDIFGVPKVLINTGGQPICDTYGDPVFNALGASTIYADTDPTVAPINDEEYGVAITDITKRHVVFLYDCKGNPLTDSVGRPLVTSSGTPLIGIGSKKSEQQNCLTPIYGKSPIENAVRHIQIFDSRGIPLTDQEGVSLCDEFSQKIVCNDDGLPICDIYGKPLEFKYGKRIGLHQNNTFKDINEYISNDDTSQSDNTKSNIYVQNSRGSFALLEFERSDKDKSITISENDFLHYNKKSVDKKILSDVYNEYGKPLRDHFHNALYDKHGIPLSGENGMKLSADARRLLRDKLKNVPIPDPKEFDHELKTKSESNFYNKCDTFGRPYFDKWGRPLYDLYGKLIYDIYGRPLTDAYDRPLIDAIGQPLLDNKGNILTAMSSQSELNPFLYDIFGRPTHDKFGNVLFDIYGRPKYDIYTNSIYDKFGRPVTDANGIVLKDISGNCLNVTNKQLYKDAKKMLSIHIHKLLLMPIMNKLFDWKQKNLKDAFGGPLFDDYGRPMYSKAGKPLFDKFGRPLYDKTGSPLCDSHGRPLSEELRSEPPQDTLSVIDSLKLLKLSGDTPKWIETNEQKLRLLTKNPDKIVKILQPSMGKPTKYIYALTRITTFPNGNRILEILEAPLSPSTSLNMHCLPWDGKPVVMEAVKKEK